jgi:hypothetical protein
MTDQLLPKGGLGASDGGADAAGREAEDGSDLGVGEAAVPQDEDDCMLAGEARQRRTHVAALVARHDRVRDIRRDGTAVTCGLLTGRTTPAGAEVVQRSVRGGDTQPSHCLTGGDRGAPERQEHLLGHVLGLTARAEHAGGDGDDPWVGGAKDLLEVASDGASPRRDRNRQIARPLG